MKKIFLLFILMYSINISAQKYVTKSGTIKFSSDAPLEKIEGVNNNVMSAIDVSKKIVVVKILVKSFKFEKALLEEHFNENYMESDEFPNSTFKGKFIDAPNMNTSEVQKLRVDGVISIHGKKKDISTIVDLKVENNIVAVNGNFNIKLEDFAIDIPSAVTGKISDSLEVSFNFNLKAL